MNWRFLLIFALASCSACLGQDVVLHSTVRKDYKSIVSVLEYAPISTPCIECGGLNHHEYQVARWESGYYLLTTTVSGGQTNASVTFRSPKTTFIATNIVLRSIHKTQPGWATFPPPLTNSMTFDQAVHGAR